MASKEHKDSGVVSPAVEDAENRILKLLTVDEGTLSGQLDRMRDKGQSERVAFVIFEAIKAAMGRGENLDYSEVGDLLREKFPERDGYKKPAGVRNAVCNSGWALGNVCAPGRVRIGKEDIVTAMPNGTKFDSPSVRQGQSNIHSISYVHQVLASIDFGFSEAELTIRDLLLFQYSGVYVSDVLHKIGCSEAQLDSYVKSINSKAKESRLDVAIIVRNGVMIIGRCYSYVPVEIPRPGPGPLKERIASIQAKVSCLLREAGVLEETVSRMEEGEEQPN